jgi:hypothetical protein
LFIVMNLTRRQINIGLVALIILVVIILAVLRYRSRSKFVYPVPAGTTPDTSDTAFTASLGTCQDTYNQALIAAGTDATLIFNAEKARATCISTASGNYVTGKCPLSNGTVPTAGTPEKTQYDAYQTNLVAIQQAYVTAQRLATSTSDTMNLNAARKADMSGATRKYIASICPAFYKPSTGTDPTSTYTAWAVGDSATNGFRPSAVNTMTAITAWADYAATTFSVAEYFKSAVPSGTSLAGIKLTTVVGLAAGDAIQLIYQIPGTVTGGVESAPTYSTVTGTVSAVDAANNAITVTLPAAVATGIILGVNTTIAKPLNATSAKWKMTGGTTTPNWKLARDAGPGTVPQPAWATTA